MKITFIARAGFQIAIRHIARGEPTGASFWTAGASAARPRFGQRRRWVRAGKNAGAAPLCERSPDDLEPVELILNPRPPKTAGYTLVEVMVILSISALLVALLASACSGVNRQSKQMQCGDHLKAISLANRVWAGDNQGQYPATMALTNGGRLEAADQAWQTFQRMSNLLLTAQLVVCPADTDRLPAATNFSTFLKGHISYFVNPDVSDALPQALLSGDDNFTIDGLRVSSGILDIGPHAAVGWAADRHVNCGNISLTDGSVQLFSTPGLSNLVVNATNHLRLALP